MKKPIIDKEIAIIFIISLSCSIGLLFFMLWLRKKRTPTNYDTDIEIDLNYNKIDDCTTAPGKPNKIIAELTTSTTAYIKWDAVNNATYYRLYVTSSLDNYTLDSTYNYNTIVNLQKGISYNLSIQAFNSCGQSEISDVITFQTCIGSPNFSSDNLNYVNTLTGVNIELTTSLNADEYFIISILNTSPNKITTYKSKCDYGTCIFPVLNNTTNIIGVSNKCGTTNLVTHFA